MLQLSTNKLKVQSKSKTKKNMTAFMSQKFLARAGGVVNPEKIFLY